MTSSVAEQSPAVKAMLTAAKPVRLLTEGGATMRSNSSYTLPRFPRETDKGYAARVASTWLFDGVGKTIEDMAGKVFAQPVNLVEPSPEAEPYKEWLENIDLEGRDLSVFAKDVFMDAMGAGISWVMADAPPLEGGETIGRLSEMKWRPYLVHVKLEDMLGWKWQIIGNAPTITQVRIMESVPAETEDEFADDRQQQVRVLTLEDGKVGVRLYQKAKAASTNRNGTTTKKGEWVVVSEYDTGMTKIMVRPLYTDRKGFWDARPPLARLAEVNMAHFRSQSDVSNMTHAALAPMKYFLGFSEDEIKSLTAEGAGYAFASTNENAQVGVVEHDDKAIGAGRAQLKEMEFQMQALGLQLIISRTSKGTATGDVIDENKTNTRLGDMADQLKDTLEQAIADMAEIGGKGEISAEIFVNKDFSANALAHLDMQALDKMNARGVISNKRYIEEAKRRDILAEDVDADEEASLVETEAPDGFGFAGAQNGQGDTGADGAGDTGGE